VLHHFVTSEPLDFYKGRSTSMHFTKISVLSKTRQ